MASSKLRAEAPTPTPAASGSDLSLYFPHADRGQSILLRVPPNHWVVIDANQGAGDSNCALEILELNSQKPGFQIIALVITHFHDDHYSGVAAILDFCEKLAKKQRRNVREILRRLILPSTQDAFYQFLRDQDFDDSQGHLKKLQRCLDAFGGPKKKDRIDRTLSPLQFAWKQGGQPDLQDDEAWIFTFYPNVADIIQEFFTRRGQEPELRTRRELTRRLQANANRFAYLLGVGYGRSCEGLHFLLTSDLPGTVIGGLTDALGSRILPEVLAREAGAAYGIDPLIDRRHSMACLRPIHGLTVPHHGSGTHPVRHSHLHWWLGSGREPRSRSSFAIVQGAEQALRENTVEELWQAGLRVFATSPPDRLLGRNGSCKALSRRLPADLRPSSSSRFRVVKMEAEKVSDDDAPDNIPRLSIRGGADGIREVDARDLYEVVAGISPSVVHHTASRIL